MPITTNLKKTLPPSATHRYSASAWYMEHNDSAANSHKFYQVFVFETGLVIVRWGRIGTAGQSSVTQYPTYDAGYDVGMRQVYAKKSKGYVSQYDDVKFLVDHETLTFTRSHENPSQVVAVLIKVMEESRYAGAKDAVLQHYVSFSEQAQKLLHRAATSDLAETIAEYEALEQVWTDIQDQHDEVQVVMDLAKQTLAQKLMGGLS